MLSSQFLEVAVQCRSSQTVVELPDRQQSCESWQNEVERHLPFPRASRKGESGRHPVQDRRVPPERSCGSFAEREFCAKLFQLRSRPIIPNFSGLNLTGAPCSFSTISDGEGRCH